MFPLLICSLAIWVVILERLWSYRKLGAGLRSFQLEAMNALLRGEWDSLRTLCAKNPEIPTAQIVMAGMERIQSKDARLVSKWASAMERERVQANQSLRGYLWVLGTVGSASPFIGLFGTVVGILKAFQQMAQSGSGGFTVVASGISESLIATAAGIVVAVIAVIAFNAFQTRAQSLVLIIRAQTEEIMELMQDLMSSPGSGKV